MKKGKPRFFLVQSVVFSVGLVLSHAVIFSVVKERCVVACRTGVSVLRFAGEREGEVEARGERGARVTRDGKKLRLFCRLDAWRH